MSTKGIFVHAKGYSIMKYERHKSYMDKVAQLLKDGASVEQGINTLGNSTYLLESLPLSIFIFLSNTEDPIEALWSAVNSYGDYGGDTDSIGYLVGSYLGAYFGERVFPPYLVENLENSSYYISLADKLYEITKDQADRRLQDAI